MVNEIYGHGCLFLCEAENRGDTQVIPSLKRIWLAQGYKRAIDFPIPSVFWGSRFSLSLSPHITSSPLLRKQRSQPFSGSWTLSKEEHSRIVAA